MYSLFCIDLIHFIKTKIMKQILLMASIALFSFSSASAQCAKSKAPCCNKKSTVYHAARGQNITMRERKAIAHQQQDVRLAVRVAKSDGYVTPAERRIIRQEKAQVSNTVYRAKNNNRNRY